LSKIIKKFYRNLFYFKIISTSESNSSFLLIWINSYTNYTFTSNRILWIYLRYWQVLMTNKNLSNYSSLISMRLLINFITYHKKMIINYDEWANYKYRRVEILLLNSNITFLEYCFYLNVTFFCVQKSL